jgi:penicillin-binding protein 1C
VKLRLSLAVIVLALGYLAGALVRPLPSAWFVQVPERLVLDRHGAVLARRDIPGPGGSSWVPLQEMAPSVVQALVAAEDHRFYDHAGVDLRATARAVWASVRAGRVVQGGSTLTQQTARLLAERPRGLPGKAVEAWRAVRLDLQLDKEQILEWYLNRAYFGRGAYGLGAAAQRVFDESPRSLSLAEAALLVGLLPAPERLHPEIDPQAARRARDRVLQRMVQTGVLQPALAELARAEPIELRPHHQDELAPHLVARVLDEHPQEPVLRTTLDRTLQQQVEQEVTAQLAQLDGLEVDHAAVLVVDVPSGEILAYVGSGGWQRKDGQFDGVRGRRSPGSALKPFVYALAIEAGWRPSDVLFDIPRRYPTRHGSWAPENYDRSFRGPLSLREALATSANLPAVQLLDEVGPATLHTRLREIGFDLPEPTSHYGLGLALGDAEVTLEALTAGYSALAREGRWRPLQLLRGGRPGEVPLVQPDVAAVVADILADPVARRATFGRYGPLERPYRAASKTGTSTGYRDNWTVGFTDRYAVGVWVGNFDGRPMGDVSGVTGAGPLWAHVMDLVTRERSGLDRPRGERRAACALSGGRPTEACPHRVEDWVPEGAMDRPPCRWHRAGCPVAWPPELVGWARDEGLLQESTGPCAGDAALSIIYPVSGTVVYVDPRVPPELQKVALRAAAPVGAEVEWRVDGVVVGRSAPGEPALWQPPTTGLHEVTASLVGRSGSHDVRTVEVRGRPSSR